jgi:hypothetical protein
MKEICTKDKPEHHGEFVSFPPMMTWPKPSQKPHPGPTLKPAAPVLCVYVPGKSATLTSL